MAAGSAAIFFSSKMSPAAFTMHTLTVSRDTSRPAKYSIFLSLGCHTECHDSRLGSTARLLHLALVQTAGSGSLCRRPSCRRGGHEEADGRRATVRGSPL